MKRGFLMVFEGLDRSGKSTHSSLLHSFLSQTRMNNDVIHKRFPNRTTNSGQIIDQYLQKQIKLDDREIHELFSQNRHESKDEIINHLEKGTTVILDRYSYSGAVYSAAKGLDLKWCFDCEAGLPVPDYVFYMDATPEQLACRAEYGDELYENLSFQQKVHHQYTTLQEKLRKNPEKTLSSKPWIYFQCYDEVGQPREIDDVQSEIRNWVERIGEEDTSRSIEYFTPLHD